MGMNLSSKMNISPKVMTRQVGDDAVILDLASGTYFGLDPVGARIWALMGEGKTLNEICDSIEQEYEVERPTIEADVLALTAQLQAEGLISVP